jgi:hypothetical protein
MTGAPTSPLVSAILAGRAPAPVKLSAARGVLPLSRAELVRVLVFLVGEGGDDDITVRDEAAATLAAITDDELVALVIDPATPADVLDHFGGMPGASPAVRNAILANPSTPDQTMRRMIPSLSTPQIDDLLLNQRRLIDTPALLDLLELNPASTALQRSRMEEIRRHFLARPEPLHHEPKPAAVEAPAETPAAEIAPEDAPGKTVERIEEEEDKVAAMRIMRLTTAEKVKLAFRASREERMILIRDTSRSVQSAVLDCPMLTDQDVEQFARMRTVSDEVLRTIAGNRSWMKNYHITLSLATNPKTPVRISMNLVTQLNARDLRAVVVDKNVPEAVRRQARKVIEAKNARQGRH